MTRFRVWLAELILGKHGWVLGKSQSIKLLEKSTTAVTYVHINDTRYPVIESTSTWTNSPE